MSRIRLALVAAAAALALAALVPLAEARTRAPKAQTVTVTMVEFKFTFGSKVHAGKVTFRLVDKGKLAHDLKIAGKKSPLVKPGKTGTLVVTLKKGKYPYLCTVKGHAAAGMKGVLTVT
jgi:uncharacterized cupredoxin-like copper-binding protein